MSSDDELRLSDRTIAADAPIALTHRLRLFAIRALAVIGTFTLLGGLTAFTFDRLNATRPTGMVRGPDSAPLPDVPVFLMRGDGIIERVTTDSAGRFTFRLLPRERERAMWLICAPGGVPMMGRPIGLGPSTFMITSMEGTDVMYRRRGWYGPIPRECPQDGDAFAWRLPPGTGGNLHALSSTEPEWE